ncbi:LysR substrate-binding domain-containing protein [Vibrio sp. DW001]|uniref:LysR substrate-binding domain-containing protein n=1 Tax=Vibrio sp. DW001 TaxID=2912315 RepID=UPI0023AE7ED6|nr:LysR substrate-binding domain-containing protein [Vibrio sp. DW001]WED25596.1 LysR substrate-binding domain-containing protein [Vibrio sp. DW001]
MHYSLPSLNALRAFETVARHLNYHSAAEELRVTPAAVKQLVSRLEQLIGTPLLKRKGRGLVLTSAGERGVDDLSLAMKHMKSSVDKMQEFRSSKQLIISVEPSFSSAWLIPRLAQFKMAYPDIAVLIDSSPQLIDLERSNVDIAIRYGVRNHDNLVHHRLINDQIMPACSPAVANALPPTKALSDLLTTSLIHWDTTQLEAAESSREWFVWKNWLAHFGSENMATSKGLHFSEYNQALQAAIGGQGFVLVSKPILKNLFQAGLLICPFKEMVSPDIGYDVVVTKEAMMRSDVQIFVDWIIKAVREDH